MTPGHSSFTRLVHANYMIEVRRPRQHSPENTTSATVSETMAEASIAAGMTQIQQYITSLEAQSNDRLTSEVILPINAYLDQQGLLPIQFERQSVDKNLAVFHLKKILLALHHEKKVLQKDLTFLGRESLKVSETVDVLRPDNQQRRKRYKEILVAFEKNSQDNAPAVNHLLNGLNHLIQVLESDESSLPDILPAFDSVVCRLQGVTFSLKKICGITLHDQITKLLRARGYDTETFREAKQQIADLLLSSRLITAIIFLQFFETKALPRNKTLELDFNHLVENTFFDHVDRYVDVTTLYQQLEDDLVSDSKPKKQHALAIFAAFLRREVGANRLNSTLARQLLQEARQGEQPTALIKYLASFIATFETFKIEDPHERSKNLGKVASIIATLAFLSILGVHVVSEAGGLQRIIENSQRAVSGMVDNYEELIERLTPFEFTDSIENANSPEITHIQQLEIFQSGQNLLVEQAERELAAATVPPTLEDMQTHETDGMGENFRPSRVSYEGYHQAARSIAWELKNWQTFPSFFSISSFDALDTTTGNFSRWVPSSEMTGRVLAGVAPDELDTTQNILVGERTTFSSGWVEVPHPSGMKLDRAAILIFNQDGTSTPFSYAVEMIESPSSDDQFVRFLLRDEDRQWMAQNQANVNFKLVLIYSIDSTPDLLSGEEVFVEHSPQPVLSLQELPGEFQSVIQQINSATTLTDEQRLRLLQQAISARGIYSFNPRDDQNTLVEMAIGTGLIPESERVRTYYGLFFFGDNYPGLDLEDTGFPRELAGECNRRNSAAWVLGQLIDFTTFHERWNLILETGIAGADTVPNTSGEVATILRDSSSHMRLVARSESGRVLVLDSTFAPQMDEDTRRVIENNAPPAGLGVVNFQAPLLTPEAQTTGDQNFSEPQIEQEYIIPPENQRYEAVIPDVAFNLGNIDRNTLFGYTNSHVIDVLDTTEAPLPWSYQDVRDIVLTDQYNPANVGSELPWNQRVFTGGIPVQSLPDNEYRLQFSDLQPNISSWISYREDLPQRYLVSFDVTLRDTNVFPLFNSIAYGLLNPDSVKVSMYGNQLPFRIMTLASQPGQLMIIIDASPEAIQGQTLHVEYINGIADMDYFTRRMMTRETQDRYIHLDAAIQRLSGLGLTEGTITRLFIENALIRYQLTPSTTYTEDEKSQLPSAWISLEVVRQELEQQTENYNLRILQSLSWFDSLRNIESQDDFFALIDQIDQEAPTLLREWIPNLDTSSFDAISIMGYPFFAERGFPDYYGGPPDGGFLQALKNYLSENNLPLGEIYSRNDVTDYSFNHQVVDFRELLFSYLFNYLLPQQYPYEADPAIFPAAQITLENSIMTTCGDWAESQEDMVRCYLSAPYRNEWMKTVIQSYIFTALNRDPSLPADNDSSPELLPLLLRPVDETQDFFKLVPLVNEYSWEYSIVNPMTQTMAYIPDTYLSPLTTTTFADGQERSVTLETRTAAFQEEVAETQAWYMNQLLEKLANGDPNVWSKLLGLFLPLALISSAATFGLAYHRRWRQNRDIIEMLFSKRTGEPVNRVSDRLVGEFAGMATGGPITNRELDKVWHSDHNARFYSPREVFLKKLVVDASLKGTIKFPFSIPLLAPKPEIHWGSREVPPTFSTHVINTRANILEWANMISPINENKLATSLLSTYIYYGINGWRKSSQPFERNDLVLRNPQLWVSHVTEAMIEDLKKLGITNYDSAMLDYVVHELALHWKLIMIDWRIMHDKPAIQSNT